MANIQSNLLDNYLTQYKAQARFETLNSIQTLMKRDRPALTVPEKDPGDDGSDEPKEEEKPEEEKPGDLKIDLDDQRDELKRISAEINHISDGLKEPEKEKPEPEKPGQGDDGENSGDTDPNNGTAPGEDGKTEDGTKKSSLPPITQAIRSQKPSRPLQPLKTSLRLLMSRRTIRTILKGTAARTYLRQKKG